MQTIGITGHQSRPGIDWSWVRASLRFELQQTGARQALSSLAAGSDQIFADESARLGLHLISVIPLPNYDRFFKGQGLEEFRRLLAMSEVVQLPGGRDEQQAFYDAGIYVSRKSSVMLAVWDEQPSEGFGGTADVVADRLSRKAPMIVLNPIHKTRKALFLSGG